MKRKSARPHSQLILLSDSFEPMIDYWCSGSVVFEIDPIKELNNFPEAERLVELLFRFGERYTKLTVITNPKESAVTMCKLSGKFSASAYIVGKTGYKSFESYFKSVDNFFRVKILLEASKSYAITMKRFSNFKAHRSYLDYKPSKDLRALLITHEKYESPLRHVLDSPFR